MFKEARAAGILGALASHTLPSELGRYVYPGVVGAGLGALGGAATADPGDRASKAMLGGMLGGLGGGALGHFRQFRIGDPKFRIRGNKVHVEETYGRPTPGHEVRRFTLRHSGGPIAQPEWERAMNIFYPEAPRAYA